MNEEMLSGDGPEKKDGGLYVVNVTRNEAGHGAAPDDSLDESHEESLEESADDSVRDADGIVEKAEGILKEDGNADADDDVDSDDGASDDSAGDDASDDAAVKEVYEKLEPDEDGTIKVRVGNFLFIKDTDKHHPYITVLPIARTWYVGYSIDLMAYAYLNSVLFADEGIPSDEDLQGVYMFVVGVAASATALDAKFTDTVIKYFNDKVK